MGEGKAAHLLPRRRHLWNLPAARAAEVTRRRRAASLAPVPLAPPTVPRQPPALPWRRAEGWGGARGPAAIRRPLPPP